MGHAFAAERNITPWEGLLWAVRIAAGRVAYCESKLATATCDEELQPGGRLDYWVSMADVWHTKLARVSKLAIDAGVAERLVRQLELEAQLMLRATKLTLEQLGLADDVRDEALRLMSQNLIAIEAEEVGVVATIVGE